jgi:glutamate 5-kinase
MIDLARQEIAASARLVIVKVGSRVLTTADGKLDDHRIDSLGEELSELMAQDRKVVLVSSGAVAAGIGRLGLDRRPTDLAKLQAVAAVGQAYLIETYDRVFRRHGHHAAQVLLTSEDLNDRTRYLNVRNTILTLLEYGAVPVVNENDTVAVDELAIAFGDNDRLAAMVTNLIRAPLMVILSDVDGLFDGDPASPDSKLVPTVTRLDDAVMAYVRDKQSGLTKGGMASKLSAARMATLAGENVVIANGHVPGVLRQIMAGRTVGTLLLAQGKSVSPWKRWIGFSARPCGQLVIDAGAQKAVLQRGRSLLAAGVLSVSGSFRKGDIVALCDADGMEIARGLTNYPSDEIAKIRGLQSRQIAQVLGYHPYDEVIHRDNLAITAQPES